VLPAGICAGMLNTQLQSLLGQCRLYSQRVSRVHLAGPALPCRVRSCIRKAQQVPPRLVLLLSCSCRLPQPQRLQAAVAGCGQWFVGVSACPLPIRFAGLQRRESGASEADLESLALLMGHSVKEQRGTYDRRTKSQKVQPAVDLMLELAEGL
jgi:hypothetical protein